MRASERISLIDKIGRELQAKYRYDEIDTFLSHYRISLPPERVGSNSKWIYSKAALNGADDDVIMRIADELGVEVPHAQRIGALPPRNWTNATDFRLFISHISKHKDKATRLKDCLAPYAIAGFVAHEDILPTLEWQNEIERALYTMDAFVAIHTESALKNASASPDRRSGAARWR